VEKFKILLLNLQGTIYKTKERINKKGY
jgi:hypothetical protein